MIYIWLTIFIATLVVEFSAPGLVSIWFSGGSLVSLIMAAFLQDRLIWLQIVVFFVVSLVALLLLRPVLFKKKLEKKQKTNVDSLIGEQAKCTQAIDDFDGGVVKIKGLEWSAFKEDKEDEISAGDIVIVKKIEGNKLIVKK